MSKSAVVLDTNVFVAAGFNPNSGSAQIIDEISRGDLTLVWNEATRQESKAVVERIPPLTWQDFADLFREKGRYSGRIDAEAVDYVPDSADRTFAALAKAAGAVLVSNDEDHLGNRHQADVYIVTPDEFIERRPD